MRSQRAARTVRIEQVLSKGHCGICAAVKDFETTTIETWSREKVSGLCNQHAWLLAKSAPSDVTSRIFLQILESPIDSSIVRGEPKCDICSRIIEQEHVRLTEMAAELDRPAMREWIALHGSVCMVHAGKLMSLLSNDLQAIIAKVVTRDRAELKGELNDLLSHLSRGDRTGWGVLGRTAEFLTAQRGIVR